MTMTTPTVPAIAPEAALASLRAHIEEFIALELTHKLDTQLASLCAAACWTWITGTGQIWSCPAP